MLAALFDLARYAGPSRLRAMSRLRKVSYGCAAMVAVVALLLVLANAGGPGRPAGRPPLANGFSLAELGNPGGTVSLASYAGRPVVVNFYASWCAPCQRETPLLARYYASKHGRVVVLGVDANDEAAAALRFVHNAGVSYPVGFDPFPARVTTSYGVDALPQTFFLNAQHRIVARVLGAVTQQVLTKDVARMTAAQGNQDRG